MNKLPVISIIIVTYNTKELICNCLYSVLKETIDVDFEVIVSDNGSSDGTVEIIRVIFPQVIIIENNANLGFGAANNRGLEIARGKYVFYLNSDTILLNNAIKIFYDYFESNMSKYKIGVLGTNLLNADFTYGYSRSNFFTYKEEIFFFIGRWLAGYFHLLYKMLTGHYFVKHHKQKINPFYGIVDIVLGAAMFMKNDDFARFDERYFMYHEESDMQLKKSRARYQSILIKGPKIIHLGGMSSGNYSNYFSHLSSATMFYNYFSKILYFRKNIPSKIGVIIIKFFIVLVYSNPILIKKTLGYIKRIISV
jgi:GT2 family glycosyltransferase